MTKAMCPFECDIFECFDFVGCVAKVGLTLNCETCHELFFGRMEWGGDSFMHHVMGYLL
jgi:hypothetical protein